MADKHYHKVNQELDAKKVNQTLWNKALTLSDNDITKAKAEYIPLRAAQLEEADKKRQQLIKQYDKGISDIDFLPTLLICIFLGGLGIHRFFVGKTGTGILMLVTIGGLGIWWIIDIILIVTGSFTDIEGRVITYQNTNTANTAPSTHVPEKVVEAPPAKDIPAEIEKLADLKDKGIITDEEFQQKKQELLDRI